MFLLLYLVVNTSTTIDFFTNQYPPTTLIPLTTSVTENQEIHERFSRILAGEGISVVTGVCLI
jgi:hypothetical protein